MNADPHPSVRRAWIVMPPRRGTGLRHVVLDGASRALCGVNVEDWKTEAKRFDAVTIGCKRCKTAFARRGA